MRSASAALLITLAACLAPSAAAQDTWHVDGACGDDAWTGQSDVCQAPDGPKRTVQAGLDVAADGDTVLVAPGVYMGEGNTGLLLTGHAITLRSSAGAAQTVMDGTGVNDTWLSVAYTPPGTVIEGFTIRRFSSYVGALELSSLVVVSGCRFVENDSPFGGGVLVHEVADQGVSRFVNCEFIRSTSIAGGGIYDKSYDMRIEVVNCTFVGCESPNGGGVMTLLPAEVYNCVFRGPAPQTYAAGNSILVSRCNIEGEWGYGTVDGGGNIDADPVFADPGADDYRLGPGSPCIDAADNTAVPDWLTTDFGGLPRFADDPATDDTGVGPPPIVDMGAHEFQSGGCYGDFSGDGDLDLFDFLAFVNAFNADEPAADCDHSGVLDLFDFLCFVNAFNEGC